MADDYQFPDELVGMQRAFYAAEAHLQQVLNEHPRGPTSQKAGLRSPQSSGPCLMPPGRNSDGWPSS
ncbi:hypothetical protein SAMN05421833_102472 [Microbispora rosea]|uniref:Uncharacterized protein n=1 Tax=Microbispora rosea TaxID=58117 RepID=A0A1N6TTB4_9ACTN|nr:hypothetical protein Mro03_01290 [Microbispora rosea subsp. rosea]SIQ56559.1 hypothetical protein SAMN05421833_102472 [Microbispora rosea]